MALVRGKNPQTAETPKLTCNFYKQYLKMSSKSITKMSNGTGIETHTLGTLEAGTVPGRKSLGLPNPKILSLRKNFSDLSERQSSNHSSLTRLPCLTFALILKISRFLFRMNTVLISKPLMIKI